MSSFINELRRVITSNRDVEIALANEFLSRGYKKTYLAAAHFQAALEREFPSINRWVWLVNRRRREIQDVVADELGITGN